LGEAIFETKIMTTITTETHLQLRTIWIGKKTRSHSIASALNTLASLKPPKQFTCDRGSIQYLDLGLDSCTGWAWKDLDASDRFTFVQQCQRIGMDMATDEALAALDSYFGEGG